MFDILGRCFHLIVFFAVAMMGAYQFGSTGEFDELTAIVAFAGYITFAIEFWALGTRHFRVSLLYLLSAVTYVIVTWGGAVTVIQLSRWLARTQ